MTRPTRNPFHHPDNPAPPGAETASGTALRMAQPVDVIQQVEHFEWVDKPWGHEEIFAVLEGQYVGKILHVRAGHALSLQQHRDKDETVAVLTGEITVQHGPTPDRLETVTLLPGQRLLLRAPVVHRIAAVTDSRVLEASTARPGWRTDVVRLEDPYGRAGTSRP